MQQTQHADSHLKVAKKGEAMPITIEDNPEEAIETFARLATLGHFAKAATFFEDVLKSYIDELPVFAEYANFLIQQGMYGILLERVKERSNMKTASMLEEEEIVYLELLQALSMLHFEGKLLDTLEALEHRNRSFASMIESPAELTFIQIRSVETYLAIITAVISVVPKRAIKYNHNVTIELSPKKNYVFETGASTSADTPWNGLQRWCTLLINEHPLEAANVFRTLLRVLSSEKEVWRWAQEFTEKVKSCGGGPESILAQVEAMNAVMWWRTQRCMMNGGESFSNVIETTAAVGFGLLDTLYEGGYDIRSQQAIELELNAFGAERKCYRLRMGLEGLADIAREEANHRLESRCLQLIFEVNGRNFESPRDVYGLATKPLEFLVSAVLPTVSSGARYPHFAQDAIELVNFLDHVPSTRTTLQISASIGSLGAVRIILERGGVALKRSQLVHQAARKGYEAIAQLLCDHDESFLSDEDDKGYLPLHVAAESGHENLLPLLLGSQKEYIDMQVTSHWSTSRLGSRWGTALHLASANGHEKFVASLLRCGAVVDAQDDDGWTALHKASARWQYGTVNILLRHGADVNLTNRHGLTAVELAAKSGYTALVGLLLQHQSAGDFERNCEPALILAIKNRDLETGSLLLGHTKDMQGVIKSPQLKAALEAALKSKDTHFVELLLKYGADATTSIQLSLDGENTDNLKMLLDHGANIEGKDSSGKTFLHRAIEKGHKKHVQILMDLGADIEARDDVGKTALQRAMENRQWKLVHLLVDHGADITAKDDEGKTVLHRAMEEGHRNLVHLLMGRGADIEAKDDAGKTVFHYAIDSGDRDIVEILQKRGASVDSDIEYRRKLYSVLTRG